MPVASSIHWGPASIRFRVGTADPISRELPLTRDFLVDSYFLDGGDRCSQGVIKADASALWPLASNLQASFQLVFAYQQARGGAPGQWEPPSREQYNQWTFFSDRSPLPLPVDGQTGPGYKA